MPKGVYKRKKKHIDHLIRRNKSKEHIKKVKKANTGKKFTEKRKRNLSLNHADFSGEKNPRWKGGKYIDPYGYLLIYKPEHPNSNQKGYIRSHRLIMEKYVKRYLKGVEVVHHVDGNRLNNSISNLMLLSGNAAHRRAHCNKLKDGDIVFDGTRL